MFHLFSRALALHPRNRNMNFYGKRTDDLSGIYGTIFMQCPRLCINVNSSSCHDARTNYWRKESAWKVHDSTLP